VRVRNHLDRRRLVGRRLGPGRSARGVDRHLYAGRAFGGEVLMGPGWFTICYQAELWQALGLGLVIASVLILFDSVLRGR